MGVKIEIYPSCVTCNSPMFDIQESEEWVVYSIGWTNQNIICKHVEVCKFIENEEPIRWCDNGKG